VTAPPVAVGAAGTSVLAGAVMADDGSGQSVRRARVRIRAAGLPDRMLLSDDDGRFLFSDLPAGTYAITADKPGWITGYYGSAEPWKAPGTPVALGEGERRTDLEIRLAPGAAMSGRLVDEFGQPQAGARVIAFQRQRHAGRDTFTPRMVLGYSVTQLTDDRGEFRLFQLPPGDYLVGAHVLAAVTTAPSMTTPAQVRWAEQVRRAGVAGAGAPPARGTSMSYVPQYHPGVVDPARATVVTLGVGEQRHDMEFTLRFVPSVTVGGTLTLPDGRAAAGVPVHLLRPDGPIVVSTILTSGLQRTARTGADGGFTILSVTPGEYTLIARGVGPTSAGRGRAAGPGGQPSPMLWADQQVSVGTEDVDGLDIRLQPGLTVSGRVVFAGSALDPPDDLEDISVGVLPEDRGGVSVRVPPVAANADGTFEVRGLAPGRYILTATAPGVGRPGQATWLAHRADVDGRNALELPFEVQPGRAPDDLIVEFTDRPAEVSGQVTDARGRPVQGLTMVLFPADPANWAVSADERSRRTAPLDDNGRYRIGLLPAGDYFLAALAEIASADLADPAYLEQVASQAIRVSLTLGEKKVQDVRVGGTGGA